MSTNGDKLWKCVYRCNGERNCTSACVDSFEEEQKECPCEVENYDKNINQSILFILG